MLATSQVNSGLEIPGAGAQSPGHAGLKRFLCAAQRRHGELQQPGLALDLRRCVAIAPVHALTGAAPIMVAAEKRRRPGRHRESRTHAKFHRKPTLSCPPDYGCSMRAD